VHPHVPGDAAAQPEVEGEAEPGREARIPVTATAVSSVRARIAASAAIPGITLGHGQDSNFNRRVWQPATRAAGVEGLRVHDLRHTAGTLATAAGGSLREVMQRLGHATTVAAVRYQHVMADRDAAIARELNRLIEGG
jgi:integrase